MGAVVFEIANGFAMTFLFFVLFGKATKWQTTSYFIVPAILVWAHVLGKCLQHVHVGPEWLRGHLHDVGVATGAILFVALFAYLRRRLSFEEYRTRSVALIMRIVVVSHGVSTLLCVGYKISQVTLFREYFLSEGYSGEFDYGDTSMFVLGFVLILLNHFVMRRRVLRKRDAYVGSLEARNELGQHA